MSALKRRQRGSKGRRGQSATEYMLTIAVLTIAALAATSAFSYAYVCVFNGTCEQGNNAPDGLPQSLADSLTNDGIQGVGNGQYRN